MPPAEFFERPDIELHLGLLWEAFSELSTERQFGMGVGPIPRSKIKDYLTQELDLSGDAYEHAYAVMRRVDGEYVSMINKAQGSGGMNNQGQVSATDPSAMKSMFGAMAKKPAGKNKAKKKK